MVDLEQVYEDERELFNAFEEYAAKKRLGWKPEYRRLLRHWSNDEFADQYVVDHNLRTIRECIEFFCNK